MLCDPPRSIGGTQLAGMKGDDGSRPGLAKWCMWSSCADFTCSGTANVGGEQMLFQGLVGGRSSMVCARSLHGTGRQACEFGKMTNSPASLDRAAGTTVQIRCLDSVACICKEEKRLAPVPHPTNSAVSESSARGGVRVPPFPPVLRSPPPRPPP